jgi:hypothetical protein
MGLGIRVGVVALVVCLGLAAFAGDAAADRLFATTGQGSTLSTLVELDPATGAVIQTIGPVGYVVNGMTWDPTTNTLFAGTGVTDPTFNGLITIDVNTGAGTPIGASSWGFAGFGAVTNLTVDGAGNLWAWWEGSDDLVSVDKVTGLATVIGDSFVGTAQNGLTFDAVGTLWMVNSGGTVYTVDTVTGLATFVTVVASTAHHGDIDPASGLYYGLGSTGSGTNNLVVIDLTTLTVVNTITPAIAGLHVLAFVDPVAGPVADAGPDQTVECQGAATSVTLDGSGSSDPALAPLTYTWTGPFDGGTATGVSPTVTFSTGAGAYVVTLVVNNGAVDSAPDTVTITIQDTSLPVVSASVVKSILPTPTRGLFDVGLQVSATDPCDGVPTLAGVEVWSDEADAGLPYSPDATLVGTVLRCRAERAVSPGSNGRVYLIIVRFLDASGNTGSAGVTVSVPLNLTVTSLTAVQLEASNAQTTFATTGLPPAGWTQVL